jgi:hypothetical protein
MWRACYLDDAIDFDNGLASRALGADLRKQGSVAEENASTRLRISRRFHKLNHHRLWRYVEVRHQNIGHLARDLTLLFDAAAFRDVNINFGHAFPLRLLIELLRVRPDRDASAMDEQVVSVTKIRSELTGELVRR